MESRKDVRDKQASQRTTKKFLNVFRGPSRAKVGDTTKKNDLPNGNLKSNFLHHVEDRCSVAASPSNGFKAHQNNITVKTSAEEESGKKNFLLRVVNENGVAIVEDEELLKCSDGIAGNAVNCRPKTLIKPDLNQFNEIVHDYKVDGCQRVNRLICNDLINSPPAAPSNGCGNTIDFTNRNSRYGMNNNVSNKSICNCDTTDCSNNFSCTNGSGNGCSCSCNCSSNGCRCPCSESNPNRCMPKCSSSSNYNRQNTPSGCSGNAHSSSNNTSSSSEIRTYLQTVVDCVSDGNDLASKTKWNSVESNDRTFSTGKSTNDPEGKSKSDICSLPIKETDICETEVSGLELPSTIPENWASDIPSTLQWLRQQIAELKNQDRLILRQLFELGADIHNVRGPVNSNSFDLDGPDRLQVTPGLASGPSRAVGRSCSSLVPASLQAYRGHDDDTTLDGIGRVSSTSNLHSDLSDYPSRDAGGWRGFARTTEEGRRYLHPVLQAVDFPNSCEEFFV